MRKIKFSIFLAVLLLVFTACGADGNDNEANNGNNNNNNEVAEENNNNENNNEANNENDDGEEVTINFYSWENESANAEQIKNFEEENPGIKINYDSLVNNNDTIEFYQKLDIQMGAGEEIDVVAFSHVDFLVERAARGVLAPITEELDADGIDPEDEFFVVPSYEGEVYGTQSLSQPWLVAINKDALDEADLPVPEWGWTWDDFREYAEKLTTDDRKGAYFHTWGEYASFPAYAELEHPYLTEDEEPVFGDDAFADFFNFRRQLEEDGSVKTFQDAIASELHYASEFFNEEAAMLPVGSFFLEQIIDQDKYPHDFLTVFAPLPRSSEDVEVGSSYVGGQYLAIGESSQHKEEAYEFIKYMSQQTDVIRELPGSRNVDQDEVLDKLISDHGDLIDEESLAHTVYDDNIFVPYDPSYSTAYSSQLKDVLEDGFSLFMLDGLDAEEAQEIMIEEANTIKDRN